MGRYGEVYVMDWGLARVKGQAETRDMRLQASVEFSRSVVRTERTDAKERDLDSPLLTMDGTVVGTPFYMPPEQALGMVERIGPRSDVYAVGSMLYHLVSGLMPYYVEGSRPSPYAVLAMVAQAPPRPLRELAPEVPSELIAICEKAMARDPERRYADMGELREDLSAYIEHRVVHAYQTGAVAEFKKWVERNLGMAASIAAAIGLVSAALVWGTVSATREANRAQKEAEAAQRARGFVVELYQAFDPFADTRAVLESKVDELLKQLDDLPVEKADSLEVIASLCRPRLVPLGVPIPPRRSCRSSTDDHDRRRSGPGRPPRGARAGGRGVGSVLEVGVLGRHRTRSGQRRKPSRRLDDPLVASWTWSCRLARRLRALGSSPWRSYSPRSGFSAGIGPDPANVANRLAVSTTPW